MTNHIHLLGTPEHDASIGKVFQSVGRRYVQYFNYTYRRLERNAQDRSAAYRSLFKTVINKADLAAICDCTRKSWVLGSDKFKAKIEEMTQRQVRSKGVGRPRIVLEEA